MLGQPSSSSHTEGGLRAGRPGRQLGQDSPFPAPSRELSIPDVRAAQNGPEAPRSVKTEGGGEKEERDPGKWGVCPPPPLTRQRGNHGSETSDTSKAHSDHRPRRPETQTRCVALSRAPPAAGARSGSEPLSSSLPWLQACSCVSCHQLCLCPQTQQASSFPGICPLLSFPPGTFFPQMATHTPRRTLLKRPLLGEASSDHLS